MIREYYKAYDDRYRQVHGKDLQWFSPLPSPIVQQTLDKYGIGRGRRLLEIGCGEGRDAQPLLEQGFSLLASDVSPAAIDFCQEKWPQYAGHFRRLDCICDTLDEQFDFIFGIAVIHMLVLDADRDAFYRFIREHLKASGIGLICSMGDGEANMQTDIQNAFSLQQRIHMPTGMPLQIAATSCRMVDNETFEAELTRNGLAILEKGITSVEPDFPQMMYAVVSVAGRAAE